MLLAASILAASFGGTERLAVAQAPPAGVPPADFGSPPSGEVAILFNDRHVYAKPARLKANRVLAGSVRGATILVALESMFEQMGATVSYDPASKTVDVSKPGSDVKVTVGKPEVVINGESRPVDVPPEIYKGAVVLPVRVIAEGMGAYVQWVPDRRIVVVRYVAPSAQASFAPTIAPTFAATSTPTPTPGASARPTALAIGTPRPVSGSIIRTFDDPDGRPVPKTPRFGRYSYVLLPTDRELSRRFLLSLIGAVTNRGETVAPTQISTRTKTQLGDPLDWNAFYLPVNTLHALAIDVSEPDLQMLISAYDYSRAAAIFGTFCRAGSHAATLRTCKQNAGGLRGPVVLMVFSPLPAKVDPRRYPNAFIFDFTEPASQYGHTIAQMEKAIAVGPKLRETLPGIEAAIADFMIRAGSALCQGPTAVYQTFDVFRGKQPRAVCGDGAAPQASPPPKLKRNL
jgi:hypothetical protein